MKSNKSIKIKIYFLPILFIGLLTAIDQLTKYMITSSFELYDSKPIIEDVFSLTYIQNTGIAWGMFKGRINILLIITLLIVVLCSYLYHNVSDLEGFMPIKVCLIFIISGGIGNMIDRIKLGYVVDFLSFDLINFPVFNVADIYVTTFTFLLFILIMFKYSDDDFEDIMGKKHKETKLKDSNDNKNSNESIVNNVEEKNEDNAID